MSEVAVSYDFEQLAPSAPVSADSLARAVAQATAEAEGIRELARREGYAEGRTAGHDAGLAEVSSAVLALGEALSGIQAMAVDLSEAVERDALEFALALAEKILSGALHAKPELVAEVVQGALRRIANRRRITVLVNPADLEIVRPALGDICAGNGGSESRDVQGDSRVRQGGAIVQTVEGEIDASVHTQLERAREAIFAELARDEPVA